MRVWFRPSIVPWSSRQSCHSTRILWCRIWGLSNDPPKNLSMFNQSQTLSLCNQAQNMLSSTLLKCSKAGKWFQLLIQSCEIQKDPCAALELILWGRPEKLARGVYSEYVSIPTIWVWYDPLFWLWGSWQAYLCLKYLFYWKKRGEDVVVHVGTTSGHAGFEGGKKGCQRTCKNRISLVPEHVQNIKNSMSEFNWHRSSLKHRSISPDHLHTYPNFYYHTSNLTHLTPQNNYSLTCFLSLFFIHWKER